LTFVSMRKYTIRPKNKSVVSCRTLLSLGCHYHHHQQQQQQQQHNKNTNKNGSVIDTQYQKMSRTLQYTNRDSQACFVSSPTTTTILQSSAGNCIDGSLSSYTPSTSSERQQQQEEQQTTTASSSSFIQPPPPMLSSRNAQKLQRGVFLGFETLRRGNRSTSSSSSTSSLSSSSSSSQLQSSNPVSMVMSNNGDGLSPCVIRVLGVGGGGTYKITATTVTI
jgi:hypothetical protein